MNKPTNPKDTLGSNKLPLHLWPTTATAYGSLGLLSGALKYGRSNFRAVGIRASIYHDALLRHMFAWWEGEEADPETGLHHLCHVLACAAIIVEAIEMGNLQDDRAYSSDHRDMMERLTPFVTQLKELYADREPKHYTIQDVEEA